MITNDFTIIPENELIKIKRDIKKIINWNDITIQIDTREKGHWHIIEFLKNKNIKFIEKKLDTGDFSFFYNDFEFSNIFSIDRKKDINELIGNFKEKRFEREIERAKKLMYFSIGIEDGQLYDIYEGLYRSRMISKSAFARFIVFSNYAQFDFLQFIHFGDYLINKIYYFLYSYLIIKHIEANKNLNKSEV
jgi:hypothetical protein